MCGIFYLTIIINYHIIVNVNSLLELQGWNMAQCKKENIREAILTESLQLFARNGFEETTVKDIAERCNISTGNVYKYFENKADIYENLITDEFLEQLYDKLAQRTMYITELQVGEPATEITRWFNEEFYPFIISNANRCIILKNHYLGREYDERIGYFVDNLLGHKKRALFRLNREIPPHFLDISAMLIASNVQMYVQVLEQDKPDPEKIELLKLIDRYHIAGIEEIFKEIKKWNIKF